MVSKQAAQILELAKKEGVLRPRDLDVYNLPREVLRRMERKGVLRRVDRGLYIVTDTEGITEHHSLAEVSKKVPHGVVCLLSALAFHGLTTQAPFEVWMAISRKARRPRSNGIPVRFVRFSGFALEEGVEEHTIEGVQVRIYKPAKTVVDCFKYRNKIGIDVAIEALRDCCREHLCANDDLWHYAKICRMTNVMQPYLESIA
jgi:predicted transcriptional regulator of viral defense system